MLTTSLRVVSTRERLISCLTALVHRVDIGSPALIGQAPVEAAQAFRHVPHLPG